MNRCPDTLAFVMAGVTLLSVAGIVVSVTLCACLWRAATPIGKQRVSV